VDDQSVTPVRVPRSHPDQRHRQHAGPRRPHRINGRFSDSEFHEIQTAATWSGLTPAGFCAEAALAAARGGIATGPGSAHETLRELLRQLFAARTAVNRFGTNVNQVAAAYNSTGETPSHSDIAIALCGRAVGRLDEVVTIIRAALR
jgi:hypothetical protein